MDQTEIKLFVMHGCQVCPQMEKLFKQILKQGLINRLEVFDVIDHPELAQQYNIRSVPYYLINDVAFYGLKSQKEIEALLQQEDSAKWQELIRSELSEGQLESVEKLIQQESSAREAMMGLLADTQTPLVVRIGLSAIIESMAGGELLKDYDKQLIELTEHNDESIAIDAMYYLSLLATTAGLNRLKDMAQNARPVLQTQASELLNELSAIQ